MPEQNGTPKTPAELAREAEFLSIKCDELRHACLGFLGNDATSPYVSTDDVEFVRAELPRRDTEGIMAAYRRYRDPGAVFNPMEPVSVLTARVATLAGIRDRLRSIWFSLLDQDPAFQPPTQEEIQDMLHGPRGQPIEEIIAELEKELHG
jgi:hypothetical protein